MEQDFLIVLYLYKGMTMKIMFDDLTKEAQIRLLEEVGVDDPEDMGWDIKPVAVVKFEEDEEDDDEGHWDYDDDDEDFVDYGYDDDDEE